MIYCFQVVQMFPLCALTDACCVQVVWWLHGGFECLYLLVLSCILTAVCSIFMANFSCRTTRHRNCKIPRFNKKSSCRIFGSQGSCVHDLQQKKMHGPYLISSGIPSSSVLMYISQRVCVVYLMDVSNKSLNVSIQKVRKEGSQGYRKMIVKSTLLILQY